MLLLLLLLLLLSPPGLQGGLFFLRSTCPLTVAAVAVGSSASIDAVGVAFVPLVKQGAAGPPKGDGRDK